MAKFKAPHNLNIFLN